MYFENPRLMVAWEWEGTCPVFSYLRLQTETFCLRYESPRHVLRHSVRFGEWLTSVMSSLGPALPNPVVNIRMRSFGCCLLCRMSLLLVCSMLRIETWGDVLLFMTTTFFCKTSRCRRWRIEQGMVWMSAFRRQVLYRIDIADPSLPHQARPPPSLLVKQNHKNLLDQTNMLTWILKNTSFSYLIADRCSLLQRFV